MWRASRRGNGGLLRVIVLVEETLNKRPRGQGTPYTRVLTLASAFWPFGQLKWLSKRSEHLGSLLYPSVWDVQIPCAVPIFFCRGLGSRFCQCAPSSGLGRPIGHRTSLAIIKVPFPPRPRPSLHSIFYLFCHRSLSSPLTGRAAQPPEFSPRDVVGLTWSLLLIPPPSRLAADSSLPRTEFPSTMVGLRCGRRRAAWPTWSVAA